MVDSAVSNLEFTFSFHLPGQPHVQDHVSGKETWYEKHYLYIFILSTSKLWFSFHNSQKSLYYVPVIAASEHFG